MLGVSGIFSDLDVDVTLDAPVGAMTWFGIGGRADVLLKPRSIDALATLARRCRRSGTPMRVLGRGANLLVSDGGVDGVVLSLDIEPFRSLEFNGDGESVVLRVGGGADFAKTLMECARRGLDGLSHMAGIPASVGGAIRMNAGGAFGSVSDHLIDVTCLSRNGEVVTHPRNEIPFAYRESNIAEPVILGASFRLAHADPIALRERIKEIFAFKKSTQPLADHSAGCTFKNPIDPSTDERVSAGKLIDESGLKGARVGGAVVSAHHANFITVEPGAKADDVIRLMDFVRAAVLERRGIELVDEVVIWRRGEGGEA